MNFARDVVDAADPARIALVTIDADGRRTEHSFGAVSDGAARLAGTLVARGVGPGDVVMTVIGNRLEWVLALVACFRIGAVALPCTEQLRAADLRARMDAAEPAAVLCDERNADTVRAAGFAGTTADRARRAALRRRPRPRARPGRARAGAGGVHLGHLRHAEADPPRPALPGGPAGAGRALVRRPPRRAGVVHRRQRLVEVGAQLVHRPLAAGRHRTAPRRPLRPRRAPGAAGARARGRALHGAHGVPRDGQAHRAARVAHAAPRRGRRRAPEPGDRAPAGRTASAFRCTTATARPRPAP